MSLAANQPGLQFSGKLFACSADKPVGIEKIVVIGTGDDLTILDVGDESAHFSRSDVMCVENKMLLSPSSINS